MKRFTFLLAILLPMLSYAYTIDEIFAFDENGNGGYAMQSNNYTPAFGASAYGGYVNSFGTKFDRISDSRVRLTAFRHNPLSMSGDEDYPFDFYLSDASGNETTDGKYLAVAANASSPANSSIKLQSCTASSNGTVKINTSNKILFKITKVSSSNSFYFESTGHVLINLGKAANNKYKAYANVRFDIFVPNMFVTQTINEYASSGYEAHFVKSYDITYPVYIDINETKKTFTIKNFANRGRRMGSTAASSIPSSSSSTLGDISGTVNPTTKKLTFAANQWSSVNICYISNQYRVGEYFLRVCNLNTKKLMTTSNLTATYDLGEGIHHNSSSTNGWVTNGGNRRTYNGTALEFANGYSFSMSRTSVGANLTNTSAFEGTSTGYNAYFTNAAAGIYNVFTPMVYTKTSIANDVTADIDFQLNSFGADNIRVYVNATLTEVNNTDYVDSYELYVLPGRHNNIANFDAAHFCNTHGHIHATNIADERFDSEWVGRMGVAPRYSRSGNAAGEGEYVFNKIIPLTDLNVVGEPNENAYTFFVKINYTEESGLTPTFHNLTYRDITTGIYDIESGETGVSIQGTTGAILVEGADAPVEVFATSGAKVYSGNDTRIAVAPGLYIVRTGATTAKALVR